MTHTDTDIFCTDYTDALGQLVKGETLRSSQISASALYSKYGGIIQELKRAETIITNSARASEKVYQSVSDALDPYHNTFSLSQFNVDDLETFKFIKYLDDVVAGIISNSTVNFEFMKSYLASFLPILTGETAPTSGNLPHALKQADLFFNHLVAESQTFGKFQEILAGVYLATRKEYKRLRNLFVEVGKEFEAEETEDDRFMANFFGKPHSKKEKANPIELIEDNCVLTQNLLDISKLIPKVYEKKIAVADKDGNLSGRSKSVKKIDEGEIEDFGRTLTALSHPTYVKYLYDFQQLTAKVMSSLTMYYDVYCDADKLFTEILKKLGHKTVNQIPLANPNLIEKPFLKINFLAIRPDPNDILAKTKTERDYKALQTKLLLFLKETIDVLSNMIDAEAKENYAISRINIAVKLKGQMDDVIKTQHQRDLTTNIFSDNEFYISKSGEHGALQIERAPAPKIKYKDVIGESFVKAKEHVTEVVNVASHPYIMRVSAPRGNIKSNLMLIGPYGCGKTEIAKAIGNDPKIIGFSLSTGDLLTAYMHESVKNIKRMYEHAADLRKQSRYTKPVAILLDEFDRLFSYGEGTNTAYDGPRMEGAMQEMMDGVNSYEGVFLVALTNVPKQVPEAILRRFKYVDVVGQLTQQERATLFQKFLSCLPISPEVSEDVYLQFAEKLDHAPGDVIGKVADEIHFKFMRDFCADNQSKMSLVEKKLAKSLRSRQMTQKDTAYLRKVFEGYKIIGSSDIDSALTETLNQPQIKMQINKAREVYRDAEDILKGLSATGLGFGAQVGRKNKLW